MGNRARVLGALLALAATGCAPPPSIVLLPATHERLFVQVWGSGPADVWFVGSSSSAGAIYHWNGSALAPADAPAVTAVFPTGIWGSAANDVWIVGQSRDQHGVILHYDGVAWSPALRTDALARMGGVWGAGPRDVWVAGFGVTADPLVWTALALHFDGVAWTPSPLPSGLVFNFAPTVRGTASNDVWLQAEPQSGQPLLHWDGTAWGTAPAAIAGASQVWPTGSDVWVVGPGTQVRSWNRRDPPTVIDIGARYLGPIWASARDDVRMLSGRCEQHSILGGCTRSVHFVARWNGNGFVDTPLGEETQLEAIFGTGPTDVWVAGDGIQRMR